MLGSRPTRPRPDRTTREISRLVEREESRWTLMTTFTKVNLAVPLPVISQHPRWKDDPLAWKPRSLWPSETSAPAAGPTHPADDPGSTTVR